MTGVDKALPVLEPLMPDQVRVRTLLAAVRIGRRPGGGGSGSRPRFAGAAAKRRTAGWPIIYRDHL